MIEKSFSNREEVIKKLAKMKWLRKNECLRDRVYMECVYDIMYSKPFWKMHDFIQHGTTTTLEHCISVSYMSYKISRAYGFDYVSTARGALLHDLFLYDWHTHCKETGNHFHGFTHPVVALHNAMKYYHLNETRQRPHEQNRLEALANYCFTILFFRLIVNSGL